ncbi:hypothetical protein AJR17_015630 [Shigella boydii]|uniref:Uncharacterized protein n=1 Tax=Shigella boydii TaxID=621 RepID=A0A1S9J8U4_SHIBO|nr:hypothetical protein [Shigella dysenteriae]OOO79334.1 hypothetical protein AJR17_015630 [Shigella boydii]
MLFESYSEISSGSRKFVGYFFCMDKIIASKVCNNRECDEKSFITKPSWEREVFFQWLGNI